MGRLAEPHSPMKQSEKQMESEGSHCSFGSTVCALEALVTPAANPCCLPAVAVKQQNPFPKARNLIIQSRQK